jgi:hypothetical protein
MALERTGIWKIDYTRHLYGEIQGMKNLCRLAKDTDFQSWKAWRHWALWLLRIR